MGMVTTLMIPSPTTMSKLLRSASLAILLSDMMSDLIACRRADAAFSTADYSKMAQGRADSQKDTTAGNYKGVTKRFKVCPWDCMHKGQAGRMHARQGECMPCKGDCCMGPSSEGIVFLQGCMGMLWKICMGDGMLDMAMPCSCSYRSGVWRRATSNVLTTLSSQPWHRDTSCTRRVRSRVKTRASRW